MSQEHSIDIYLGLDVGKNEHHACTLDRHGNKVFGKPLPQLEPELATLFDDLQTRGTVLVVVDQPNTIGALPIAVARQRGCHVGYGPDPRDSQTTSAQKRSPGATTQPNSPNQVDQLNHSFA